MIFFISLFPKKTGNRNLKSVEHESGSLEKISILTYLLAGQFMYEVYSIIPELSEEYVVVKVQS